MSSSADFITVRLFRGDVYSGPCAFLPLAGLANFWGALGVTVDTEEKLQPEWVKGNWTPVAPAFPVLSELIQMQIDNAAIESSDMTELVREIAIGRERCNDALGLVVFEELEKAGKLALSQANGLSLSPFG